eukprot:6481516-Amphidinium_carterae.1
MPGTPDQWHPDWDDVANETNRQEELEAAVNERLLNILSPNSATPTPISHESAQPTFVGTAHRLEAEPESHDVPVLAEPKMVNEEPIMKEPETVPETPSAPAQMKPPPVPTATPASSSEAQTPSEWDAWKTGIQAPPEWDSWQ